MTQENQNPSPEQEDPAAPSGAENATTADTPTVKTPEQEIERLKLRQNAEHGKASLKRQSETQARIRELEKQIKDKEIDEAEYQGREVPLGKPMKGDVKKSKVYVRNDKGNVVKVNFGDPNMRIKKTSTKHRKSFRARHHCDNPGPRWKARYWSCKAW